MCPVCRAPACAQVPAADPGRGQSSGLPPVGAGDTGTGVDAKQAEVRAL